MKKLIIMITISLAMLLSVSVTKADTMELDVTYRDFKGYREAGGHPDFEWQDRDGSPGFYSVHTGIVKNTLGVDGKPVFNEPAKTSTSNATNFNQWYNDSAKSITITTESLTFTETSEGSGIYFFDDQTFFPIDGMGYGNTPGIPGQNHNFHFTMELHNTFTYTGGETFSFTGDDDLWVFINDKLVIDLGGVHGAANASVNLNTLGLTIGNTYSFDLFFAERNTTESHFLATTSIAFENPVVPVPGAILLGLLGMGATGLKLRRFA